MAAGSRRRALIAGGVAVVAVAVAAFVYASVHDRLWNGGPVNSVFHAADAPDSQNSVGVTSQVRALFPDGTLLADIEAALIGDGFACAPDDAAGETVCRRSPFSMFCTETWFVRYAPVPPAAVTVTHASRQLRCG